MNRSALKPARAMRARPVGVLAFLLLAACKSGPEGTYILDRERTQELLRSEAPNANFGSAELTLELRGDGSFERTIVSHTISGKVENRESGTWVATDGNVELKTPEGTVSCTTGENRLSCKSDKFVDWIGDGRLSRVVLGIKGTVKR